MDFDTRQFILSLIAAVLINCSLIAQDTNRLEVFEIGIKAERQDFFDLVEHIQIIRLEEKEQSLLPLVEWYVDMPDGFAIPEKKTNRIVLFNEDGDFLKEINRHGNGPEEYAGISSVWFRNNRIEVFSGVSRILQRFSVDGEYIETIKASYDKEVLGGAMMPFGNGYVFQQLSPSINKRAGTDLLFTNMHLSPLRAELPIDKPHPFPINLGKRFSSSRNGLYYKKILSDLVFEISDDRVLPRFRLDFGNEWVWRDSKLLADQKMAFNTIYKGEKVFEVLPDIGPRYIMITYYFNIKRSEKGFVNRKTGKFLRFDMRKENKEDFDVKFLEWEGDRLVTSMLSVDFEEFIGRLKKDQWSIQGGHDLDEILMSENPVLMKIKFK